jgi:hypothetical protein
MDKWRYDFLFQFCGLLAMCALGAPWSWAGIFLFLLFLGAWTRRTIQGYRRGERAGSRYQHHDRNDIWKDGPHG